MSPSTSRTAPSTSPTTPRAPLWRFLPNSPSGAIDESDYVKTGVHTEEQSPCTAGADSAGHAYAGSYGGGPIKQYNVSDFTAAVPTIAGTEVQEYPGEQDLDRPDQQRPLHQHRRKDPLDELVGKPARRIRRLRSNSPRASPSSTTASSKRVYISNEGNHLQVRLQRLQLRPDRQPGRGPRGAPVGDPRLVRLPGHPVRRLRGVPDADADRPGLRERRATRRSTATRPVTGHSIASPVLRPTLRPRATPTWRRGASASPTTGGSSSTPTSRSSSATATGARTSTSGRKRAPGRNRAAARTATRTSSPAASASA